VLLELPRVLLKIASMTPDWRDLSIIVMKLNNFNVKQPSHPSTFSKSGQLSAKLSAKLSASQLSAKLSAKLSASRANFQQVGPTFSKTFSK
jgi:hypothetical protein